MGAPKPTLDYASRTDAVRAMRSEGLNSSEIAVKLGIRPENVTALEHSARRYRGEAPPLRAQRPITLDQAREIAALRERGWSYARLAGKFGVSKGAIHYHCLKQGAISPRAGALGSKGPAILIARDGRTQRRFTPEEDLQLESLAMAGLNTRQISERLGRAMTSVRIRLMTLALHQELRA